MKSYTSALLILLLMLFRIDYNFFIYVRSDKFKDQVNALGFPIIF